MVNCIPHFKFASGNRNFIADRFRAMCEAVLIFDRVPDTVAHLYLNFVDFKITRKRLVDVGIVYVDRVQV